MITFPSPSSAASGKSKSSLFKKINIGYLSKTNNLDIKVESAYYANERIQGLISSDKNLEIGSIIKYQLSKDSNFEIRQRSSSQNILNSAVQNHDLGINYFAALSPSDRLSTSFFLRPFLDFGTQANTNTSGTLSLDYFKNLDKNTNLTIKSNLKNHVWPNMSAQNYNTSQIALNYKKGLTSSQDFSADINYISQNANSAAGGFSDFLASTSYAARLFNGKKISAAYSFVNRNYPANSSSSALKNEINLNLGLGAYDVGCGLVSYYAPSNSSLSYSGISLSQYFMQNINSQSKWNLRALLSLRSSPNTSGSFTKTNLYLGYDHDIAQNQSIRLNNSLENNIYQTGTSNYFQNVLGVKYDIQLSNDSSLSLGERYTIDSYPYSTDLNAARNQVDLLLNYPVFYIPAIFSAGYELKSFLSSNTIRSDYSAASFSASLDHKFFNSANFNLSVSRYYKKNNQNAANDTLDTNISTRVSYEF